MSTCAIDGCDKPVEARGWCNVHYARWRAHGDPLGGQHRDRDSYAAVHVRLRAVQGKAREWLCVDCDAPATVWSWDRTGPSRAGENSNGVAVTWGLDIETYSPRCRSHAAMMDGGGDIDTYPCGHPRVGNTVGHTCRICRNAHTRERLQTDPEFRERRNAARRRQAERSTR